MGCIIGNKNLILVRISGDGPFESRGQPTGMQQLDWWQHLIKGPGADMKAMILDRLKKLPGLRLGMTSGTSRSRLMKADDHTTTWPDMNKAQAAALS